MGQLGVSVDQTHVHSRSMTCRAVRVFNAWCIASLLGARCVEAVAVKKGSLKLDNYTFHKMAKVPGLNLLVKMDKIYGYGKWEVFDNLCMLTHKVPNLLLADVPVVFGGRDSEVPILLPPENDNLAREFNLKEKDFPSYILIKASDKENPVMFRDGFVDKSAKKPASWDDGEDGEWEPPRITELNIENMVAWLETHDIRMPSIQFLTITEMDELAEKFMRTSKNDDRQALLAKTVALAEEFPHKVDEKAPTYIKTMKKIMDTSDEYVDKELARVEKLVNDDNLKRPKRKEMAKKQLVLEVFADHKRT